MYIYKQFLLFIYIFCIILKYCNYMLLYILNNFIKKTKDNEDITGLTLYIINVAILHIILIRNECTFFVLICFLTAINAYLPFNIGHDRWWCRENKANLFYTRSDRGRYNACIRMCRYNASIRMCRYNARR